MQTILANSILHSLLVYDVYDICRRIERVYDNHIYPDIDGYHSHVFAEHEQLPVQERGKNLLFSQKSSDK